MQPITKQPLFDLGQLVATPGERLRQKVLLVLEEDVDRRGREPRSGLLAGA